MTIVLAALKENVALTDFGHPDKVGKWQVADIHHNHTSVQMNNGNETCQLQATWNKIASLESLVTWSEYVYL